MFESVIAQYDRLEPAGSDSWNILGNDLEFWHRVRLLEALRWALAQLTLNIAETRILDVGCGVGRSTRALLEFGARPQNLLGIDLRQSALSLAKSLNPAIPVNLVNEFDGWPSCGAFDLCIQCTVFSSLETIETRRAVAQMMAEVISSKGHVFWWDGLRANDFAGGDAIDPRALFSKLTLVGYREVSLRPTFSEASKVKGKITDALIRYAQRRVGYQPTHCAALFRRR
jgi:SAM-dependent methyltransferase